MIEPTPNHPKDGPSTVPIIDYKSRQNNTTALQKHVAFFDLDEDGIIWPLDTYRGFREIKFGTFMSLLAAFIIHIGFSYITWGTWIPDPFFRLKINRMHRGKHGSDSEMYTTTGDFDEDRFNYIFNMYSEKPHTHLSFWQGVRMVHGNMNAFDPFGWFAAVFEWFTTYFMIWPSDQRGMAKEDVQAVYDGSMFYQIAGKNSKY